MIIQGSNNPITVTFQDINDVPGSSMSISLRNEIAELAHWSYDNLEVSEDGLTLSAPITQEQSMAWPQGPCVIEIKWLEVNGGTMFARVRDYIGPWRDGTILEYGGADHE